MFSKSFVSFVTLAVLFGGAQARMRIVERDGRALYGRRFGQENPAVIGQLSSACDGAVCGVLAGQAISTLLAASPECAQQDMADDIIDAARQQADPAVTANMIELAQTFRQTEKNTPPDFTTNPPTNRNSVFCQTPPRNAELVGLNQAQDPANDPNVFFDPATKTSVQAGSQANTAPLGGGANAGANNGANAGANNGANGGANNGANNGANGGANNGANGGANAGANAGANNGANGGANAGANNGANGGANNGANAGANNGANGGANAGANNGGANNGANGGANNGANGGANAGANNGANGGANAGNIDLGSCTDPSIRFAAGIEGRTETSFIPNNLQEFNHGSAQNSAIITEFICDTFVNRCGANQAAIDTCAQAEAAAAAAGAKQGAAADAFNAAFGIQTNFAAIQAIDSQGQPVA